MAITSKSFDNGTACVAEQSIVLDEPIAEAAPRRIRRSGRHFSLTPADQERLARPHFHRTWRTATGGGRPVRTRTRTTDRRRGTDRLQGARRPACRSWSAGIRCHGKSSGRSCHSIGRRTRAAGYRALPADSRNLAVKATRSACTARTMRRSRRFRALPAGRIVINTPTLFGGMGYSCATDPSFMLGTGTWSGSIVSDNVTPSTPDQHQAHRARGATMAFTLSAEHGALSMLARIKAPQSHREDFLEATAFLEEAATTFRSPASSSDSTLSFGIDLGTATIVSYCDGPAVDRSIGIVFPAKPCATA